MDLDKLAKVKDLIDKKNSLEATLIEFSGKRDAIQKRIDKNLYCCFRVIEDYGNREHVIYIGAKTLLSHLQDSIDEIGNKLASINQEISAL